MNKFFLIQNQYNKERTPEYYSYVENNISLTDSIPDCDYILVLGGDGSLLDAIQNYKKYNKPFIGIHTGSIGYYMHNFNDINDIKQLNKAKLEIAQFPMLSFKAKNDKGDFFEGEAFADVWVERMKPQSLKYNICINNKNDESRYCNVNKNTIIGDGILFSTPAGSTGYTKNLGGNIIPFDVPVFQVVPMASAIDKKNIASFPLGLANNSVDISFKHVDFRKGTLIYDGISAINKKDNQPFVPEELNVSESECKISIAFISIANFRNKAIEWILD
jgi:NAD kinase